MNTEEIEASLPDWHEPDRQEVEIFERDSFSAIELSIARRADGAPSLSIRSVHRPTPGDSWRPLHHRKNGMRIFVEEELFALERKIVRVREALADWSVARRASRKSPRTEEPSARRPGEPPPSFTAVQGSPR